ncbi:MAG: hypothetical protein IPL49_21175 [Saprospirales bacterium]|nr:hypothetical protein [Saprospirales bacterium]
MNALFLSANNSMHFAWFDDNRVSAGTISNHWKKRSPSRFEIKSFKGKPLKPQDLVSISSNDSLHFAWYWQDKGKCDPQYALWVCQGHSSGNILGARRDWYESALPKGAHRDNLLFITSNNDLHCAWFRKGAELWVGRGPSECLYKTDVYHCLLPPDVSVEHILFMASNNKSHFAFLRNGTYLTGKGRKLERPRAGGSYDLAELRDMLMV